MCQANIFPYFEGKRLDEIEEEDIIEYYSVKQEGCPENNVPALCANTVNKHGTFLSTIFKCAKIKGLISENPFLNVSKPSKQKTTFNYYNESEMGKLLKVSKGDAMEVPVYLGIYFGLRRSEVVGLRWKDIDLVNRTLTINSTVVNFSIAKTTIFQKSFQ